MVCDFQQPVHSFGIPNVLACASAFNFAFVCGFQSHSAQLLQYDAFCSHYKKSALIECLLFVALSSVMKCSLPPGSYT